MSGEKPLVSIIVRTKDRPKLLKRAIQSIASQTYRDIEVILVNDGGCDIDIEELKHVLGDLSLNYIRLEENAGRAHAGNLGVAHAQGKYIGFLDDDDEFLPAHLMTLVSFLEQSDYSVAYTDSLMIYKEYNAETHELHDEVKKEVVFSQDFNYDTLVFENYIPFMCLLFGREPLVSSGGFDTGFDLYEDWDLLIRIGRNHPFYHIRQVTANYNQWSVDFQISQANRDPIFLRQAYLKVLSRHLDKITPNRIHDYMSGFVHTRNLLKDVRKESEAVRGLLREKDVHIDTLHAELNERTPQVEQLSRALQEKDAVVRTMGAELQEKISQVDSFTVELKEKDTQIDILTAELKERASQVDTLTGELKERGSQLDTLIIELRERGSQFENLYAELTEKGPRAEKLYTELRERDAQINKLYAELKEKRPQVEKLYNELRERASQVETLTTLLRDRDSQVEILTGELRERASQVETFAGKWKEWSSQMEMMRGRLKEKESQVVALAEGLKEQVAQVEALTTRLRERTAQAETLTADLRGKDAQIIILHEILQDKESLISAMKNTRGWKILERYRHIRDRISGAKERPLQGQMVSPAPKTQGNASSAVSPAAHPSLHRRPDFSTLMNDVAGKPIPAKVSVIIPTKDAGDEFDYTLRRITQQEGIGEIEVVIVDSGSSDNTINLSNYYTRNIVQIPSEEFHHASTRNLGAEKATGEFLVFTVQDAIPVGNQWLYKLIYPIYRGNATAVSARQIPRADADIYASWAMWVHTDYMGYDQDRMASNAVLDNFDRLDMQGKRAAASLDSVCLGIKKSTFDAYRFRTGYAEDFDLGLRLLKDNHTLLFQSSNAIIHSHNRPAIYFLKRGYVDTISLWDLLQKERKNIPVEPVLETAGYLYAILKVCMAALKVECELGKDPVFLVHSLMNNFEKKMNGFHPSLQPVTGDPLLDEFFAHITSRNHQQIASEMYAGLRGSLESLARYVECFQTIDDIKEDFLNSIYKLFSNTAGYYLGANTQADIAPLSKGV